MAELKAPKTDEEVIEFAKVYYCHKLIKEYLETKDKKILEEIKNLLKK